MILDYFLTLGTCIITISWWVTFLLAAGLFHAMGEVIVLHREDRTWWIALYTWDLGYFYLDAKHFYRGLGLTLSWVSVAILAILVYTNKLSPLWLLGQWVVFYQWRNFWMHFGLLKTGRRWPFFRIFCAR